jgi:hypothetical protein
MTKPLSWGQLLAILVATCQNLPDQRTGKNSPYTIRDAALGVFGVFFTRTPRSWPANATCNGAKDVIMPRASSASATFPVIRRFAICWVRLRRPICGHLFERCSSG